MRQANTVMINILVIGVGQYSRSCYISHFLRNLYDNAKIIATLDLKNNAKIIHEYLGKFPDTDQPSII